jgi:hypothetical protein
MSRCADFNSWVGSGAPSYTNHGSGANLDITGSLSIDAWVRLRQPSVDGDYQIFYRSSAGNGYTFKADRNLVVAGKNTLCFSKSGGNSYPTLAFVVNGALTHIAVVWNSVAGDVLFYVNGVLVQTVHEVTAIVSPGVINSYIGHVTAGSGINGCVYSLNVYNRVLSLAEINYNMQHPADAIRRGRQLGVTQESWVGGVWKDLSPNAYDGTPTGVVLSPYNNIAGRNVSL